MNTWPADELTTIGRSYLEQVTGGAAGKSDRAATKNPGPGQGARGEAPNPLPSPLPQVSPAPPPPQIPQVQ